VTAGSNVEIIRLLTSAFNRRDLDAFSELTTPDVEWLPVFAARVEGDPFRGREGIEAFLAEVAETWEQFRPVPEEFEDLGDRVLALGRLETRGRGSGVPVQAPWGGIFDLREGRVCRIRTFLDHDEARRTARGGG